MKRMICILGFIGLTGLIIVSGLYAKRKYYASAKISNSFEEIYKKTNPTLNYYYDEEKQIHNYSNNWDFDNDGINDEVSFIGTGGAHLYYFLRIILSSDKIVRDFPYLESDYPILPPNEELIKTEFSPKSNSINFAVLDISKNNSNDIFIRLDNSSFLTNKENLIEKGIKTNLVVITFRNSKLILRDFDESKYNNASR